MWSPDLYLAAWNYAAQMHGGQKVPGMEVPYLAHIGAVAMEVMTALAQGSIGVSAGTLVGTTLVGNTVNADAGSISGTTIAANQSTVSGANTAGTTVSTASTAPPPAATKTTEDASTTVAAVKKTEDEEDPNKKKKPLPQLVRTSGRVTVILPPK